MKKERKEDTPKLRRIKKLGKFQDRARSEQEVSGKVLRTRGGVEWGGCKKVWKGYLAVQPDSLSCST